MALVKSDIVYYSRIPASTERGTARISPSNERVVQHREI